MNLSYYWFELSKWIRLTQNTRIQYGFIVGLKNCHYSEKDKPIESIRMLKKYYKDRLSVFIRTGVFL